MVDKFMEVLDSCWELTTDELRNLVAQLEGVIEEREEENDDNNYCINCGCEKEDYESMYCDECWEEEQARLEEEMIPSVKCISFNDNENGLVIKLVGTDDEIIDRFDIILDIKKYNENQMYKICSVLSNTLKDKYYENNGKIEIQEIYDLINETLENSTQL